MRISVVTYDQSLYECLSAILADLAPVPLPHLILVDPRIPPPDADLYIWDYSPEQSAPWQVIKAPSHHLLLVDRKDLPNLAASMAGMMLIVKPFHKLSLAGWLMPFLANKEGAKFVLNDEGQERQWSDFLAKAVHDFRAPLTAASGYCGLVLTEELGRLNDRQKEVLGRTQNSLARLARMTSELLRSTALAQPREQTQAKNGMAFPAIDRSAKRLRVSLRDLNRAAGEIDRCVEQAIQEVQPSASQRNIKVVGHLTPPGRVMYFDKGRLEQVLSNLLENACKFTPPGGRIEVRGYPQGAEFFRVDVFNTGQGISPARLQQVFDDYASFGSGSGMGLGLAISKRIVEQHGGRIWAENEPGGLRMSFVLPVGDRSATGNRSKSLAS